MPKLEYEPDEMVVTCLSREIRNGDEVTVGTGTPLPGVAYMVARRTHAPNTVYRHPHGGTMGGEAHSIGIALTEAAVLGAYVKLCTGTEAWDYMQSGKIWRKGHRMVEFFRPAQMDQFGNINSSVIGDYRKPKVRLPGGAGIADLTSGLHYSHLLYVPRHTKEVFVSKVDFITGLGYLTGGDSRQLAGVKRGGPSKVITDLGIFDFEGDSKRLRLISLHPGATLDDIRQNTGFEILFPAHVAETEPPAKEIVELIRTLDPLGVRKLEMQAGKERRDTLRRILEDEIKLKVSGSYLLGGS